MDQGSIADLRTGINLFRFRLGHAGQQDIEAFAPNIIGETSGHPLLVLFHQDLDAVVLFEGPAQLRIERFEVIDRIGHSGVNDDTVVCAEFHRRR